MEQSNQLQKQLYELKEYAIKRKEELILKHSIIVKDGIFDEQEFTSYLKKIILENDKIENQSIDKKQEQQEMSEKQFVNEKDQQILTEKTFQNDNFQKEKDSILSKLYINMEKA